jgi:membrane-bound metal-dependent hydrolase YbcI (DUF457 family)
MRAPDWYVVFLSSPLGLLFISYLLALCFEEVFRKQAFWCLWVGSLLHLVVDSFKDYLGTATVRWAFPFYNEGLGFPLYKPEDGVFLMPVYAALILSAELIFYRQRKRREKLSRS